MSAQREGNQLCDVCQNTSRRREDIAEEHAMEDPSVTQETERDPPPQSMSPRDPCRLAYHEEPAAAEGLPSRNPMLRSLPPVDRMSLSVPKKSPPRGAC